MGDGDILPSFIIGFTFGMIFFGVMVIIFSPLPDKISELGNGICEETYGSGSEYVSYNYGQLECSTVVDSVWYDGLRVVQVD